MKRLIWKPFYRIAIILLGILLFVPASTQAQQTTVIVPDLTGLSVPQAAQAVGTAGLLFGSETQQLWAADAKVKADQVSSQKPAAGEKVLPGSAVDVTVLRVFNASLVYDANSVSLVNTSTTPLAMDDLTFETGDGTTLSKFNAEDWGIPLPPGNCYQLWFTKVQDSTPTGCTTIVRKLLTTQKSKLFWLNTQDTFRVMHNGDLIANCPVTGPCTLDLPQKDDPEHTLYLSFSYRTNHLSIYNDSQRWMTISGVDIISNQTGKHFVLDTTQKMAPGDVPWAGHRLAPGQCIVYSEQDVSLLPPYDCQVVGYVKLDKGLSFWTRGFTMIGTVSQRVSTCAAPVEGEASVCLVPR